MKFYCQQGHTSTCGCVYVLFCLLVHWTCGLIIYRIIIASTATKIIFVGQPAAGLIRYMIDIASTDAIVLFDGQPVSSSLDG